MLCWRWFMSRSEQWPCVQTEYVPFIVMDLFVIWEHCIDQVEIYIQTRLIPDVDATNWRYVWYFIHAHSSQADYISVFTLFLDLMSLFRVVRLQFLIVRHRKLQTELKGSDKLDENDAKYMTYLNECFAKTTCTVLCFLGPKFWYVWSLSQICIITSLATLII